MDATPLNERFRAGLVHLGLSALVASVVTALIFLAWYPAPLDKLQGVSYLLMVVIGVDVTLGPLLTTILFDRRKGKWLFLDLGIVAALQLSALVYGVHSLYGGRPALIVFNIDRFDAVSASAMNEEGLELARQQGKPPLPRLKPRVVAALMPDSVEERNKIMFAATQGGADLPELAQYHVPYEQATDIVLRKARPLAELRAVNEMDEGDWQEMLHSLPQPEAELGYLPLKAKSLDGVAIVDRKTAAVVRILPLQPKWHG